MDWKDKLKQVKELFPKEPIEKTVVKGAKGIQRNNQSLQKDIALSEEVLEKRMTSKISFVCREFNVTKEKLAEILYLGNYNLNTNYEAARITPGMYMYLSKKLRPLHYELNKAGITKIIDKYIASKPKKEQKGVKKSITKRLEKEIAKSAQKPKKSPVPIVREPYVKHTKRSAPKEIRYLNNFDITAIANTIKTIYVHIPRHTTPPFRCKVHQ